MIEGETENTDSAMTTRPAELRSVGCKIFTEYPFVSTHT